MSNCCEGCTCEEEETEPRLYFIVEVVPPDDEWIDQQIEAGIAEILDEGEEDDDVS